MGLSATWEPADARVRLTLDGAGSASSATFYHRLAGAIEWQVVRAGADVPVSAGVAVPLLDHEPPVADPPVGVVEYQAITSAPTATFTASTPFDITDQAWLKHPGYPYLNRRLDVVERGDVSRDGRGELVPLASAARPVAVQEYMGGQRVELKVRTATWQEWRLLDQGLALGAVVLLHADAARLGVPSPLYAVVASAKSAPARARRSPVRYTTITLDEVAKPAASYAGAGGSYQTVLSGFASYSALLAAYPSYAGLLELQGSPADVIVG